ncbi:MAG: DUF523 domain-containing protein [Deltaproteobacteria bacterium]|nr:DUF523 domain-containing protein [Deltaproteobacteria bacterium]
MAQRLISACLLGQNCRYDGASKPAAAVIAQVAAWRAAGDEVAAVCPEELGGLGTPRPAAELRGGDGSAVLSGAARVERVTDGGDVTAAFVSGATAAAAQAPQAVSAVLKANSPSCGCGETAIDGQKRPGDGVFAALLRQRGVAVQTDEDLTAGAGR